MNPSRPVKLSIEIFTGNRSGKAQQEQTVHAQNPLHILATFKMAYHKYTGGSQKTGKGNLDPTTCGQVKGNFRSLVT